MDQNRALLIDEEHIRARRCRHGILLYSRHDIYMAASLEEYGEYSESEITLFNQIIMPNSTVLDIGAHIGAHTHFFAKVVSPNGHVYSFEPQMVLYRMQCANLALNSVHNVTLHNAAAGEIVGDITVPCINYFEDNNFGGLSMGRSIDGPKVPMLSIDSLVLANCHFIKVDVEGMEINVLRGATDTIKRYRPVLYVENDRSDNSEELIRWIMDQNYRLYWHNPPLFNLDNYYGNTKNVFGNLFSMNMLCLPREKNQIIDLHEIIDPVTKHIAHT